MALAPTNTLMKAKEVSLGSADPGSPYLATGSKVGPESVRATGSGGGDAAWRQNLATFSGGQFARPGGSLSFNPLSNSPFGGDATGGGSAPIMGMPSTLLQYALGMNPMTMQSPKTPPQSPTPSGSSTMTSMPDWLDRYMSQGRMITL